MPMQSRTDQVHSYQFFLQRVVSGLVAKESDPAELPFRRLGWSGFGSVMVAVLLVAGFGVYGIVVGGGASAWREGGSVIVERESGTVYLYRDPRLHPMLNVVSARLALGSHAEITRVSARSLAGVPRGATLGIPGAPEGLPGPDNLLAEGWSLCSQQEPDGRGGWQTPSVLGVGAAPAGGAVLGAGQALPVRDAEGETGQVHLVWQGHRFDLGTQDATLRALGVSRERVVPVASVWLDALPVGQPLPPPAVRDLGTPTAAFGEAGAGLAVHTGQIIEVAGAYYLVGAAELVEVTPLQAQLALAAPATAAAYPDGPPEPVTTVPSAALARAALDPLPGRTAASPPETRPAIASLAAADTHDAALCTGFAPGGFVPEVWVGARLSGQADALATARRTTLGAALADYVVVTGGYAALVQAVSAPGAPGGAWYLVTDQGVRYPLPNRDVAAILGYPDVTPVPVPSELLARLPAGPALDPAVATAPVASAGGSAVGGAATGG